MPSNYLNSQAGKSGTSVKARAMPW
jgi:hypothetical protein